MDPQPHDLSQTGELLQRAQGGDEKARNDLFERFWPKLAAYLRQRLPQHARSLEETQDMVQDVCIKAFQNLPRFEDRGIGSFWMFLRTTAHNQLIDTVRRHKRDEKKEAIAEESHAAPSAPARSPLQDAAGREIVERFEQALARLPQRMQQAITMRLELDVDYQTIADECGWASPDAARVAIARALLQLSKEMKPHDPA